MSEAAPVLENATFDGLVALREVSPLGMLTIRGDLGSEKMAAALQEVVQMTVPAQRAVAAQAGRTLAWMSPDELLLVCDYAEAGALQARLSEALGTAHALVVNVSDARAVFEIKGPRLREVIAKLAPVDMARDAFGPGTMRRSRFAQVAAAFWMPDAETARIVCFRSVAAYVFDLLRLAGDKDSAVGHF